MVYLYIDESGDLGFSKKSSSYFIVSCVKINDEETNKKFLRIPKKVRQSKLKKKHKKQMELKFTNTSSQIRNSFLLKVADLELEVYTIIIEKSLIKQDLREDLPILYNYLMKMLLEEPFKRLTKPTHLHICFDRCRELCKTNKFITSLND